MSRENKHYWKRRTSYDILNDLPVEDDSIDVLGFEENEYDSFNWQEAFMLQDAEEKKEEERKKVRKDEKNRKKCEIVDKYMVKNYKNHIKMWKNKLLEICQPRIFDYKCDKYFLINISLFNYGLIKDITLIIFSYINIIERFYTCNYCNGASNHCLYTHYCRDCFLGEIRVSLIEDVCVKCGKLKGVYNENFGSCDCHNKILWYGDSKYDFY